MPQPVPTHAGRPPARLMQGALVLYAATACALTWPLAAHLSDHLVTHANLASASDSPLNAYILSWGAHALAHNPLRLFQANMFFPAANALAFSDSLLGTQPLFAPLYFLTGNPVLAYNLTLLAAFVLNGLSMAGLAWFLFARPAPALLAGFVYAFALPRFPHLIHLQLLSAWWTPLVFLAVEAWLRRPRWALAAAATGLLWCQFLSSAYLGIMLGLLLVPYLALRLWAERGRLPLARTLSHLGLALAVGALLFTPVALPYVRSQAQWGHQRGLADLVRYSAELGSFLAADGANWLYGAATAPLRRRDVPWESALFFGLAPLCLAARGVAALRRAAPLGGAVWPAVARAQALVGLTALVLALGPILLWADAPAQWPLPYLAVFLGVPGLGGIRAPARFALLALVPLALFAAAGFARLVDLLRERRPALPHPGAILCAIALALMALEALHLPVPLRPMPLTEDAVVRRLRERTEEGAVLEIPFSIYDPLTDATYALTSTRHWAPLVNGYSGFRPGSYYEIAALVNSEGLSPRVVEALGALGVRTLVVHLDALPAPARAPWHDGAPPIPGLERILSLPQVQLYRIPPAARRSATLQAEASLPASLPAGRPLQIRLLLRERSGGPWVNPGPLGIQPIRVAWTPAAGTPRIEQRASAYLPTLVPAGGDHPLALTVDIPSTPGSYRLEIAGGAFSLDRSVVVSPDPLPQGETRAELTWLGPPALRVGAGQPVQVMMGVHNPGPGPWQAVAHGAARETPLRRLAGLNDLTLWWASAELPELGEEWPIWGAGRSALWLATPQSYLGRFVLRSRWLQAGEAVSTDLVPLPNDVFPGQSLPVAWVVPAPPSPGQYELELAVWGPDLRPLSHIGGIPRLPVQVGRDGRP